MTSKEILNGLFRHLEKKQHVCCPNYTPTKWWECDMFSLTKANMATEFEVKLSRADFKADAEKERREFRVGTVKKHDSLAGGSIHGPSRFYFVAPDGLLKLEDIPEWAGLMTCGPSSWNKSVLWFKTVKKAGRLHGNASAEREAMLRVFYWRYWVQRTKNADAEDCVPEVLPPLPTYEAAKEMLATGDAGALENFIHDCEHTVDASQWRDKLSAVVNEAYAAGIRRGKLTSS
jgi:hypothetical protein